MSVCEKFDISSKQKMKKMIGLSYRDGCEYFTIIKKGFTLGQITKGERRICYPDKLIESHKRNVIGVFHTHPCKIDFYDKTLKGSKKLLDDVVKKMNIPKYKREKMSNNLTRNIVDTFASMSPNDLQYSVSKGLTVECIGLKDKEGKPMVFCHELYDNAKERIINELNSLDDNMKDIFKKTFNKWINNENANAFIDMSIHLFILDLAVKETCEVSI